jgi:hypothetical protein
VDLSGRVVEQFGFRERSARIQVASLAAGLHASGARLSEAAGHPGPALLRIRVEEGEILLIRVPPRRSTCSSSTWRDRREPGWERRAPTHLRELAPRVPGGPIVLDAASFEDTLEPDR